MNEKVKRYLTIAIVALVIYVAIERVPQIRKVVKGS